MTKNNIQQWVMAGFLAVASAVWVVPVRAQAVVKALQYTTADGRVYISRDGGVQWLPKDMPAGGIQKLLLTTAGGERFRSHDGGQTWVAENNAPQRRVQNLLLTTAGGERFRSHDGGESWVAEQSDKRQSVLTSGAEQEVHAPVVLRVAPTSAEYSVHVRYTIPERQHVELAVVDALGRQLVLLHKGMQQAGEYAIDIGTQTYTPGVYFVQLHTATEMVIQKIVVQP